MAGKSVEDLKAEVWDRGACSGCGACSAVCPADAIWFDREGDCRSPTGGPYCKARTDAVPCGACYAACPRTVQARRESPPHESDSLGPTLRIVAARATFPIPGKQSGGAVTALLKSELVSGQIDAIVTIGQDNRTLRPEAAVITQDGEALVHTAGSRYSWWVPLLAALRSSVLSSGHRRIAVVGLPCAAAALSRIRTSDHDLLRPYGSAIRLIIGLFCTESFDYRLLVGETLEKRLSIPTWRIRRMDVRGRLDITLDDGSVMTVPLRDLEEAIRPGCRLCSDFTAVSADISAGSVGTPDGWTTIIARTPEGLAALAGAEKDGLLEIAGDVDTGSILSLSRKKGVRAERYQTDNQLG